MSKQNVYLDSKPRYEILDGLRGVAALMVVLFHCFETYSMSIGRQIVNHGYLAVDFFFVLSGFVIGYAYDDRWDRMTTWGFFKRRLTRLHPMLVAGMVVGAFMFFFGECRQFHVIMETPAWKFILCFVMGLFLIPCGKNLDIRGWNEMNSFNGPAWTLFFEYIGNILYAFVLRRLPKFALAILAAGAAFLTLNLTLGWDVFDLFRFPKYNVIGGWSLNKPEMLIGFSRLLYPFIAGLLVSRILRSRSNESNLSGSPIRLRGGFWWCALILVFIFACPRIGGKAGVPDGLFQAAAIILVFPLVVIMGAGSTLNGKKSEKFCKFLGELSFPLYITHYPFMYMQMAWAERNMGAPVWMHVMVNVGTVLLSILVAWSLYKLYDLPVRRWLTEHWLKKPAKAKA